MSTGNSSPHSVKFHPRTRCCCGDTTYVSAPASFSAFLGLTISTCSKPFSIKIATFKPFRLSITLLLISCRNPSSDLYNHGDIQLRIVFLHVRLSILLAEFLNDGLHDLGICYWIGIEFSFYPLGRNSDSPVLKYVFVPLCV